ncbi:hypothetical protein DS2_00695 [Catenovulum agarivorans DS-2]|uniref:Uncharacterized protein n=2 Tax=Catenovulum agarivorans TaxID=1172192 RepID=W7QJX6_9ALTE|nr:hypothetical protein DS2_00695 [Catenovulum agarivorans DS-2]
MACITTTQFTFAQAVKVNFNPNSELSQFTQVLLTAALDSHPKYSVNGHYTNHPIKRDLDMLRFNELDIVWHPTNHELEQEFLAIRIPITQGLLGFQSIVVKKQRLPEFNLTNQRRLLASLVFGAARGTGDHQIYSSAGLTGVYSSNENTLVHMLEGDRFDYLPTSTHRAHRLVADNPELNLTIVPNLVVSFVKPIYFFVNRNNPRLASVLAEQIETLITKGDLDELLHQQAFAAHTINKLSNEKLVAIELVNPALPEETPLANSRYWYQFNSDTSTDKAETLLSSL